MAPQSVVRELRRRFGRQQVLDGVNLECPRGQITTIVGPSGCGKTVLLKHLNLLLRPDSGTIAIDGVEVTGLRSRAQNEMREKFGMLFQAGALFDSMSVFDNVAFPLVELTALGREEIAEPGGRNAEGGGLARDGEQVPLGDERRDAEAGGAGAGADPAAENPDARRTDDRARPDADSSDSRAGAADPAGIRSNRGDGQP